jgi:UPF0755 protein
VTDLWFGDDEEGDGEDLRKRVTGRRRQESRRRGRRRLAALAAVALVGVVGIAFLVALFQPFGGDGDGEPFPLLIPEGAGAAEIGDLLEEREVVANSRLFRLRVSLAGAADSLFFGKHQFRRNMSYGAAIAELGREPKADSVSFVIPEGLSRKETAGVVRAEGLSGSYTDASIEAPELDPDEFGADGKAKSLEGFLFPATYELAATDGADALVAQQLEAFRANIAEVDLSYAKSKNLTVYDVLTIASMVEREISVDRERRLAAAVIYNRLKRGEPLGIDATVRFATGNWERPLTESELATDSPYNTRLNGGLPPGPIGNPGLASIRAAANPARSKVWLYVVKPGTCGEHVFTDSLEEHNRNVERYREAQAEAGGSPTVCD